MDLVIKITTEGAAGARAALDGITGALRQQADQVRAYSAALRNGSLALQQMLSTAAALLGATQVRAAVRAAQDNAAALAQLRGALRSTGQASADLERALLSQAEALERSTGVADETVLAVQRILLSLRATGDQVRQLTPLVLDMAAALGTDPVQAARLLGSALDGQAQGLSRYNITARNIPDLIRQVSAAFGGQAEALHRARGPLAETGVLLANLREELGRLILPALNAFLAALNERLGGVRESLSQFSIEHPTATALLRELAAAAGQLAAAFGPETVALAGAALLASTALRAFTPLLNLLRVAFFALAGPLQAASRALGLLGAATDALRGLLASGLPWITRAGAAFSLLGGAVAAVGAALAGFKLGEFIGQIRVLGDTIENHLVRALLRAQLGWMGLKAMLGLEALDEAKAAALLQAIEEPSPSPTGPEQEPASGAPPAPGPTPAALEARLRAGAAWADLRAREAQSDAARLAALRLQLSFLRQISQEMATQLDAARQAALDTEGRVVQTEAVLEAEKQFLNARQEELRLSREIEETERRRAEAARAAEDRRWLGTFPGQLGEQSLALLNQIGTAAQNAAFIVTGTLGAAFRSIADQITQLILGTISWGQALANIGRSILAQLVASIVNFFVTLAARALLSALFGAAITKAAAASSAAAWAGPAILASTATYGTAPAVGTAALTTSLAAAPAISAAATFAGGFAAGGLVPPGERLIRVNEEGPEFVVNAAATARHLPLLEAINRGTEPRPARAAPERPLRVVIVDHRRDADELLRDPRWKSALVNLSLT